MKLHDCPVAMQVKVLPDSADEALVSGDSLAYIKITSVKPVSNAPLLS